MRKDCPKLLKKKRQLQANSIDIDAEENSALLTPQINQVRPQIPTVNKVRQGYAAKDARTYKDALLGKKTTPKLEAPSWSINKDKIPIQTGDAMNVNNGLPPLEETFIANLPINGVKARCLIDSGASGDFLSSHFAYVNRVKHRKLEESIPLKQAVKGSKPKCNAIAEFNIKLGDWTRKTKAYVANLVDYDAMIGLPTLVDSGASIDFKRLLLTLSKYGAEIPLERYTPPIRQHRPLSDQRKRGKQGKQDKQPEAILQANTAHPAVQMLRTLPISRSAQQNTIETSFSRTIRTFSSMNYHQDFLLSALSIIVYRLRSPSHG